MAKRVNKIGYDLTMSMTKGKRFVRCGSLGEDYTEHELLKRLEFEQIVKAQDVYACALFAITQGYPKKNFKRS